MDAEELVPGDVIQLLPGDPIPADARVISSHRLQVEESALTGESRPVSKSEAPVLPDVPLGDRRSMVFRGTTVVGGQGHFWEHEELDLETGRDSPVSADSSTCSRWLLMTRASAGIGSPGQQLDHVTWDQFLSVHGRLFGRRAGRGHGRRWSDGAP